MRSFLFVALVSIAACATEPVDTSDQLDAPAGKEDAASKPAGAYSNTSPNAGELATLSLDADHTFTATEQVECIAAPCNPVAEKGTYLFTHSTTKHYIRLYAVDGTPINRYEWKLSSRGQLQLRLDSEDSFFSMTRGGSCEAAGGTCVPLVPDACYIGSVGDATEYSCGGGIGVMCCLPDPECTPPDPGQCPIGMCYCGTQVGVDENCCPIIACPQVEAPAACPATCAADADCATGEACQSGFCYAITPPAPTPCEAAGGACVALYPGNCADGTIGDATEYSCGGGLGVMCCLPR